MRAVIFSEYLFSWFIFFLPPVHEVGNFTSKIELTRRFTEITFIYHSLSHAILQLGFTRFINSQRSWSSYEKHLDKQTPCCAWDKLSFVLELQYQLRLTRIIVFHSLLRLTCSIPVCVSGCRQPKQNYAFKCKGYKINNIKLSYIIAACLFSYHHLAWHVAGRVGPRPHLRLNNIFLRVWHAPHSLAHPCHRAPNNLSLIYSQMVFNFIVYLCKHPKLLIYWFLTI